MSTSVWPNLAALKAALPKYDDAKLLGVAVNCAPADRCEFNWFVDYDQRGVPNAHYRCSLPTGHAGPEHFCVNVDVSKTYQNGSTTFTHDVNCEYPCCAETVVTKRRRF